MSLSSSSIRTAWMSENRSWLYASLKSAKRTDPDCNLKGRIRKDTYNIFGHTYLIAMWRVENLSMLHEVLLIRVHGTHLLKSSKQHFQITLHFRQSSLKRNHQNYFFFTHKNLTITTVPSIATIIRNRCRQLMWHHLWTFYRHLLFQKLFFGPILCTTIRNIASCYGTFMLSVSYEDHSLFWQESFDIGVLETREVSSPWRSLLHWAAGPLNFISKWLSTVVMGSTLEHRYVNWHYTCMLDVLTFSRNSTARLPQLYHAMNLRISERVDTSC